MPFKSKAQRRKFAELLVKGEISEETFGVESRDGEGQASRASHACQEAELQGQGQIEAPVEARQPAA